MQTNDISHVTIPNFKNRVYASKVYRDRKKANFFIWKVSFTDLVSPKLQISWHCEAINMQKGDLCKGKVILPWHRLTTAYTIQFEPINLVPWNVNGFACSTTLADIRCSKRGISTREIQY